MCMYACSGARVKWAPAGAMLLVAVLLVGDEDDAEGETLVELSSVVQS